MLGVMDVGVSQQMEPLTKALASAAEQFEAATKRTEAAAAEVQRLESELALANKRLQRLQEQKRLVEDNRALLREVVERIGRFVQEGAKVKSRWCEEVAEVRG